MSLLACGRGRGALKSFSLPIPLDTPASPGTDVYSTTNHEAVGRGQAQPSTSLGAAPQAHGGAGVESSTHMVGKTVEDFTFMEARVTEILDVSTVWAQIEVSLKEFDHLSAQLHAWCIEKGAGMAALPKVREFIAVTDKETGTWMRARVTRQLSDSEIEVFFVDTGTTRRVKLSSVCRCTPPMLGAFPARALQCNVEGVEMLPGEKEWSKHALERLTQLVWESPNLSAYVHQIMGKSCVTTLLIPRAEELVSLGALLAEEGLVKYTPTQTTLPTHIPLASSNEPDDSDQTPLQTPSDFASTSVNNSSSTKLQPTGSGGKELSGSGDSPQDGLCTPPKDLAVCDYRECADNKAATEVKELDQTSATDTNQPILVSSLEERGSSSVRDGHGGSGRGSSAGVREKLRDLDLSSSDENEWDESLLPPRRSQSLSEGSDITPHNSPHKFSFSSGDSPSQRRRSDLHMMLNAALADKIPEGQLSGGWPGGASGTSRSRARGRGARGGRKGPRFSRDPQEKWEGSEREGGGRWSFSQPYLPSLNGQTQRGGRSRRRRGGAVPTKDRPRYEFGGMSHEENIGGDLHVYRGREDNSKAVVKTTASWQQCSTEEAQERTRSDQTVPQVHLPMGNEGADCPLPSIQTNPAPPLTAAPPPAPPPAPASGARVITGMTEDETRNEVQWYMWKMKQSVTKVLESLTAESVGNFPKEAQTLLNESFSKKLLTLPNSKGPAWIMLQTIIMEVICGTYKIEFVVFLIGSLHTSSTMDLGQLLCPVLEDVANACLYLISTSPEAKKKRHRFCLFLGKLFSHASQHGKEELGALVYNCVQHFLATWSKCAVREDEVKSVAFVECFVSLSREIGHLLDATERETLDNYFKNSIKEHILAAELPRSARELLLEVTCERERGWVGPQLSQKTDNQPQAFFQEVPQGQKVLRPVPIPGSTTGVGSPSTPGTLFAQQQQQPQVQESSRQLQDSAPLSSGVAHPVPSALGYVQLSPSAHPHIPQPHPNSLQPSVPQQQIHYQQQAMATHEQAAQQQFQYQQQAVAIREQVAQQQQVVPSTALNPYARVMEMLNSLGLYQLLNNFQESMISDSVLECDQTALKAGLKDTGIPAGAIISILDYLERQKKASVKGSGPSTPVLSRNPLSPPSSSVPFPGQLQHTLSNYSTAADGSMPPMNGPLSPTQCGSGPIQYGGVLASPKTPQSPQLTLHRMASISNTSLSSPALTSPTSTVPRSPQQEPGERKYGFGAFSCCICRSKTHRTEECMHRSTRFFV